jgi:hypothetical protein
MRLILIVFLIILICSNIYSQTNLVSNPSFEDTLSCPTYFTQINLSNSWSSFKGSPDYFNSCNNTYVGVPVNETGYQNARSGNAYAGFYCFAKFATNDREILGTELLQSLTIGQKYFVKFYVSLAIGVIHQNNIATNNIGALFSTRNFTFTDPIPINNYAQIYSDSIISDSINWTKIEGAFIADSAYRYFSIGCFFNDSMTSRLVFDTSASISYYFVDDVSISTDSTLDVEKNNILPIINIFPNPAKNWVEIKGNDISNILLYNILGQPIFINITQSNNLIKIDLSDLPSGVYIIKLKTKGKYFISHLLVQKN